MQLNTNQFLLRKWKGQPRSGKVLWWTHGFIKILSPTCVSPLGHLEFTEEKTAHFLNLGRTYKMPHKRRYKNEQKVYEKVLHPVGHHGTEYQVHRISHQAPAWAAKVGKTDITKCWHRQGKAGKTVLGTGAQGDVILIKKSFGHSGH